MKWFRLYNEIVDDPKMLKLDDKEFRHFIYFLCVASECEKEGFITLSWEEISWRLRIPQEELKETIKKLKILNIISDNGRGIEFTNWKKRQFKSDDVTSRTRKFKEKERKKGGTFQETFRGTHQNRTEQNRTEQNKYSHQDDKRLRAPFTNNTILSQQEEIVNLYHETLPELPEIKKWTGKRQKMLKARLEEDKKYQNPEWWKGFFEYVRGSPFLMGEKGDFQANLEWLIRPNNFLKVIEGHYHR